MTKSIRRVFDPNKNIRRVHPFVIWRVMEAMRNLALMKKGLEPYFGHRDIATVLFSNFHDLKPYEQDRALSVTRCGLRCLASSSFAEEEYVLEETRCRYTGTSDFKSKMLDRYRVRKNIFCIISRDYMLSTTRQALDHRWAMWIGRRDLTSRLLHSMDPL